MKALAEKFDGEVGSRIGDIFEKRVVDLFLELQFDEILRFKNNIDFIGITPKGFPEKVFKKPKFCPEGVVAVDATTDTPDSHIDKLLENIKNYNNIASTSLEKVQGAILVSDFKLDRKYIEGVLKTKNIYVWDIRRLTFYSMKVFLRKKWLLESGEVQEVDLDNDCSYIYNLVEKKVKEPAIINAAIFIENLDLLQLSDIHKKIEKFVESISRELRTLLPLIINLQIHILNDWIKCNDSDIIEIINKVKNIDPDIQINQYESIKDIIFGYGSGPWHPILYSI